MRCCWDKLVNTWGARACHLLVPKSNAILFESNHLRCNASKKDDLMRNSKVPLTHPIYLQALFLWAQKQKTPPYCSSASQHVTQIFTLGSSLTTAPWFLVLLFHLVVPKTQSHSVPGHQWCNSCIWCISPLEILILHSMLLLPQCCALLCFGKGPSIISALNKEINKTATTVASTSSYKRKSVQYNP